MSKYWINLSKDTYVEHGLVDVDVAINNNYRISCEDVIACSNMDCDHCILNFAPMNSRITYIKHRIEQEI